MNRNSLKHDEVLDTWSFWERGVRSHDFGM